MSIETLEALHQELKQWLQQEKIEGKTKEQLSSIDQQVDSLLEQLKSETESSSNNEQNPTMMDTLQILETRFAAEHPEAEQILRRLINHLSNMGI